MYCSQALVAWRYYYQPWFTDEETEASNGGLKS